MGAKAEAGINNQVLTTCGRGGIVVIPLGYHAGGPDSNLGGDDLDFFLLLTVHPSVNGT